MRKVAIAALAAALVLPVAAQQARAEVTVEFEPGSGQQFAQQAGIDVATLQAQLRTELERLFQTQAPGDYLRRFGDAQAFSTRGLGVDYASNLRFFMVGFSSNVSINAEEAYVPKDTRTRPPVEALGTNFTLMGGVNLGLIGLKPITLYGNYWKSEGQYREFRADLENRGVHVQVKLFGPGAEGALSSLIRWGGIDVTSGFDYARTTVTLARAQTFVRVVPVGQMQGSMAPRVTLDTIGAFTMGMSTWSVPLEVTTNVRLLELVSLYGGGGFDWQLGGEGEMRVDLQGNMTGEIPGQTGKLALGTVRVSSEDRTTPSKGRLRGIAGAQLNLWVVKLFAQVNFVPDPFSGSLGFGGRVAW